MIFSSVPFLFFFLILFFVLYYIVPFKLKNYCILIFSLIFYAWGEPIYVFLMLFTTLVDYFNGLILQKNPKHKKVYLLIAVLINLSLLCFFKYADLLITTVNSLAGTNIKLLKLALPVGISFYTFQSMSYSIDVYNGKAKVEKNYFYYLMYVSMFPQLVAGPIVRYQTISDQLYNREISLNNFFEGGYRFIEGILKKVLIANGLGKLFTAISSLTSISMMSGWLGLLAYTLQLYFDFSGYSDMAIGLGKMMGFDYMENFNYPYIATSVTDFWRRWHISLSSWFRDYIYIPLGGNRVSVTKNIRNILIVWALTGLWHGAAYNFILWGLYYGILLLIEKFILKKWLDKLPVWLKHIYTMFIVMIGWCLFVFDDTKQLFQYLGCLFNFSNFIDASFIYYMKNYAVNIVVGILCATPVVKKYLDKQHSSLVDSIIAFIFVLLVLAAISSMVADSYNPFLYFRF